MSESVGTPSRVTSTGGVPDPAGGQTPVATPGSDPPLSAGGVPRTVASPGIRVVRLRARQVRLDDAIRGRRRQKAIADRTATVRRGRLTAAIGTGHHASWWAKTEVSLLRQPVDMTIGFRDAGPARTEGAIGRPASRHHRQWERSTGAREPARIYSRAAAAHP